MLTFPRPDALQGDALAAELRAGGVDAEVYVRGDELVVLGSEDRARVQDLVDAHTPPPPPPNSVEEFRKAVQAATSIADLKSALLGEDGSPGAEPRRR